MTTEIKSQDKRKIEIAKLEASCEKAEAVMKDLRLTLCQMHEKQINRLERLRVQKLMLKIYELKYQHQQNGWEKLPQ